MKLLILIGVFLFTGVLFHKDNVELIKDMQSTCSYSFSVNSGYWENQCGQLIDRIQENNKLEVITDNQGHFWVEERI